MALAPVDCREAGDDNHFYYVYYDVFPSGGYNWYRYCYFAYMYGTVDPQFWGFYQW